MHPTCNLSGLVVQGPVDGLSVFWQYRLNVEETERERERERDRDRDRERESDKLFIVYTQHGHAWRVSWFEQSARFWVPMRFQDCARSAFLRI